MCCNTLCAESNVHSGSLLPVIMSPSLAELPIPHPLHFLRQLHRCIVFPSLVSSHTSSCLLQQPLGSTLMQAHRLYQPHLNFGLDTSPVLYGLLGLACAPGALPGLGSAWPPEDCPLGEDGPPPPPPPLPPSPPCPCACSAASCCDSSRRSSDPEITAARRSEISASLTLIISLSLASCPSIMLSMATVSAPCCEPAAPAPPPAEAPPALAAAAFASASATLASAAFNLSSTSLRAAAAAAAFRASVSRAAAASASSLLRPDTAACCAPSWALRDSSSPACCDTCARSADSCACRGCRSVGCKGCNRVLLEGGMCFGGTKKQQKTRVLQERHQGDVPAVPMNPPALMPLPQPQHVLLPAAPCGFAACLPPVPSGSIHS